MTRPLRLEFPGAVYHVTSRGNRRHAIYYDDADRRIWLEGLARMCERHHCVVHAFCQMPNHYHLLLETIDPTLSKAMRQLNGHYSQYFNRRHKLVGHLFQGRYKAILVQKDSHLVELSRYIVLNPIRGALISSLDEWPWSSLRFYCDDIEPPFWLERNWLLSQFGSTRKSAIARYQDFVLAGANMKSPLEGTRHQILLGDEAFVSAHQQLQRSENLVETVKIERGAVALSLADYRSRYADRNEAMARAYRCTAHTMPQIARAFGVSTRTVSRAIATFEQDNALSEPL